MATNVRILMHNKRLNRTKVMSVMVRDERGDIIIKPNGHAEEEDRTFMTYQEARSYLYYNYSVPCNDTGTRFYSNDISFQDYLFIIVNLK